jgi:hypothetical protein
MRGAAVVISGATTPRRTMPLSDTIPTARLRPQTSEDRLPNTSRVWAENRALAGLVVNAVTDIDEASLRPLTSPACAPCFRPCLLLGLLTYCYAVGVYGSQEVARLLREDPAFSSVREDQFPDWHALRHFRRDNIEAVRYCLEKIMCRSSITNIPTRVDPPDAESDERMLSAPTLGQSASREQIAEQVDQRIHRAILFDSVALDD